VSDYQRSQAKVSPDPPFPAAGGKTFLSSEEVILISKFVD
jgi:hypothetical protein